MPNKYKIPSSTKIQNWYQRNLEPYFTYYRRVFKYAWTQTKQTYLKVGWKSRVGFIVFNLIVVAIVLVLRGREEMIQEMSVFISILIAFGIVALATLIWNILIAPARLHFNLKRKVRTTAFQQYQDAQELIRKEHISIDLSMDDGLPFEEEYESNSERKIIYRVGVTDVGLDSIQSAGVILESMTSIDKWRNRTEMVILSVNLRVMGSSEKTVRIDPSTRPRRFFDVMEWYPQKSQIRICYHPSGYELFRNLQDTFDIHSKHIELTLATQGQNVAEAGETFHLLLQNKRWIWYSKLDYERLREVV